MATITNIDQFRALKTELIAKWGEALIYYTDAQRAQIQKDCEPLARYARVPWEKVHMALTNAYFEQAEAAK